ncbi:hypothetical protein Droror1_Dr00027543 [Drosera rotundifolia]
MQGDGPLSSLHRASYWATVRPIAGLSCCRKLVGDPASEVVRKRRERLGFYKLGGGLVGPVCGYFRPGEASSRKPVVWGVAGVRIVAGKRRHVVVKVIVGGFDQGLVWPHCCWNRLAVDWGRFDPGELLR